FFEEVNENDDLQNPLDSCSCCMCDIPDIAFSPNISQPTSEMHPSLSFGAAVAPISCKTNQGGPSPG
ncbi:hypothetical protein TNCT_493421, partial [Trichonephila clavata]